MWRERVFFSFAAAAAAAKCPLYSYYNNVKDASSQLGGLMFQRESNKTKQ